ncbi:MAG: hypothetical protein JWP74_576 [Marmoricola sp.]|nr:hypothetical protein [Marmoricola sp.]
MSDPVSGGNYDARRISRGWLVAAGIGLGAMVGAVVITVMIASEHSTHASVSQLPKPRTLIRGDTTYDIEQSSPAGAAVSISDPRRVTLYVESVESPDKPTCASLDPKVRLISETSDAVRVASYHYTVKAHSGSVINCSFITSGDSADMYADLQIKLKEPLGRRTLIDDRSGKAIGLLDAQYAPTPGRIPVGYRRDLVNHYTARNNFVALTQYQNGTASLEIRVRSATAWARQGTVTGHSEVDGLPATASEASYEHCVDWEPRSGLIAEVCSLAQRDFLPTADLLQIARSLPPLL